MGERERDGGKGMGWIKGMGWRWGMGMGSGKGMGWGWGMGRGKGNGYRYRYRVSKGMRKGNDEREWGNGTGNWDGEMVSGMEMEFALKVIKSLKYIYGQ